MNVSMETRNLTEEQGDSCGDPVEDLPTNYEQYIRWMELTDWPGRLTSETVLSLRDELTDYGDKRAIETELERDIAIDLDPLDQLQKELQEYGQTLERLAEGLLDVPRLLEAAVTGGTCSRDTHHFDESLEARGAKVRQTSKQVASRIAVKGSDSISIEQLNLRSVKFCQFPGFNDEEFCELPGTMDVVTIMHTVVKHGQIPKFFRKFWRKIFVSEASVAVIYDIFWWCFLDNFQNEEHSLDKEKLFCRTALHFGMLVLSLPDKLANSFLPIYPEILAMTLYTIFYHSFSSSRRLFGPDFKQTLINTCHLWVTGCHPLPNSFHNWPIDKLEMTRENSFESLNRTANQSNLPKLKSSHDFLGSEFHYSRNLFDPKGCSPLIHKFLQLHDIEPTRSAVSKCIPRLELERNTEPVLSLVGRLEKLKKMKTERQNQYKQASLENERQIQLIAKERLELEKRFQEMQKKIDECDGVLDMRLAFQEFDDD